MTALARSRFDVDRYNARVNRHECARCELKLPEDWAKKTCADCLEEIAIKTRERYYRLRGLPVPATKTRRGPKTAPTRYRDEERDSAPRCRCGLLLPCESCLPTARELATSRPGAGRTYPEGGV